MSTIHRNVLSTLLMLVAMWMIGASPASATQRTGFDHLTTGFELLGAHRDLSCEFCHVSGMFKGAPRTCFGCHSLGSRISATPKPVTHPFSSERCELCHARYNFMPLFRFDHAEARGTCFSCHNNIQSRGKGPDHIPADNNCDSCHTTNAFVPARFDHNAAGASTASCMGCHNSVRATGKPINHIQTSAECGTCHSTLAWTPVRFDHAGITGNCQSCHNGVTATGKIVGHMTTTRDCMTCHQYPAWRPLIFRHMSAEYPGDHAVAPACVGCHKTNTDMAVWTNAALRPNCAGCHEGDFSMAAHDKTVAGVRYTATELKNCNGACHIYTDATMTTIAVQKPGPRHKVTDAAYN